MTKTDVLIVGAGPTGLNLALFLAKAGVRARIVAKSSDFGEASRAVGVQARTLEFYRQMGIAAEVVEKGMEIQSIRILSHGHVAADIKLGEFGEGLSPYPFLLSFPQDEHERLLGEHLRAVGIEVGWNTELTAMTDTGDEVRVTLRHPDGTDEECVAAYVCGCDGARSAVRHNLKLGFDGGTYDKTYFVADVEATGEATKSDSFSLCLRQSGFLLVLPVRSTGMSRLIGILPPEWTDKEGVSFEDIRSQTEEDGGIHVESVNWFSTYKAHHRVASHFRVGRAFLCGDAGHIHSPVGGQGMNTGIGDAVNLAWKLGAVVRGRAGAELLDTYEPERVAFARLLVATTDRVFQLVNAQGVGGQLFRETLIPHLAPFAFGFSGVRTAAFRMVSQTRIAYPDSALSRGEAGHVHGGDRLPWAPFAGGSDNFAPLQAFEWQIHVYGTASESLRAAAQGAHLALHQFDWTDSLGKIGFERDALYLLRPDGYVALADSDQDVEKLREHLSQFHIALN